MLDALIESFMAQKDTAHWVAAMEQAGIPCAPVQSIDQTLANEQTQAIGMVQQVPDSSMTFIGLPARFEGVRPPVRKAPSMLNQDAHLLKPYLTKTGATA